MCCVTKRHCRSPGFEADIRIARQLEKLWLEKGGGGNCCESYTLPWYFAALHTAIDWFEKRGQKGYLFTVGDELPTYLPGTAITRFLATPRTRFQFPRIAPTGQPDVPRLSHHRGGRLPCTP